MAASDFVVSAKQKIREGDVAANRPNSEAVNKKISGSVNSLIDSNFYQIGFKHSGFFTNSDLFRDGPQQVINQSEIISFEIGIAEGKTGSNLSVQVEIYDDTGASVGDLWSAPPSITAVNNGWSYLFVDIKNATSDSVGEGGAPVTPVTGTLSFTTLTAGWLLVPKIISTGSDSSGATFNMRLREQ